MDDPPELITIEQAAERLTTAGLPTSVRTLREWRTTWPNGARTGPMPLLLRGRRLRYEASACDEFVRAAIAEARAAAQGGTA